MSRGIAAASQYAPSPPDTPAPRFVRRSMPGHSGDKVLLYAQDKRSFVRKTAGKPLQNVRLTEQSSKLRHLARCGVPVPRVLGEGETDAGLSFYDMEYVPARTIATAICDGAALSLPALLLALERMFTLFQLTQGVALAADAFLDKIARIESAAGTGACAPHRKAIGTMACRLGALSWQAIPASESHGDLTLENILLTAANRVVFIDCDGGWLSSWWIDAAKLYQDVLGHWFLRSVYLEDEAGQPLLRAVQRLERLKSRLDTLLANLDPALPPRLAQLAGLHLFRTLPYARDERLVAFVLSRMDAVLSPLRV